MQERRDEFGIGWNNKPPATATGSQYRLERLSARDSVAGIVLNQMVFGCHTHWGGNSTKPHFIENCSHCDRNARLDWHGYIFLMWPKTRDTFLFELKPSVADGLGKEFDRRRTLRGLKIRVLRQKPGVIRSRHLLEILGEVDVPETLPKVPDVMETLYTIWGVRNVKHTEAGNIQGHEVSEAMLARSRVVTNGQTNGHFSPDHD